MSSYRFVHNKIFYVLDLLASLTLLCLTICEEPCNPKFKVNPNVSFHHLNKNRYLQTKHLIDSRVN